MSDIDTAVVDSLKVLDLKRPIREADIRCYSILAPQNRNPPTRNPNSRKLRLECAVRRRRSERVRTFGGSPRSISSLPSPRRLYPRPPPSSLRRSPAERCWHLSWRAGHECAWGRRHVGVTGSIGNMRLPYSCRTNRIIRAIFQRWLRIARPRRCAGRRRRVNLNFRGDRCGLCDLTGAVGADRVGIH